MSNVIPIDACTCGHSLADHPPTFYGRHMDCHADGCGCEHYRAKVITRESIIRDAKGIRAEIIQTFTDAASWNDYTRPRLFPDADPIDPDPDGQMQALLNSIEASLQQMGAA